MRAHAGWVHASVVNSSVIVAACSLHVSLAGRLLAGVCNQCSCASWRHATCRATTSAATTLCTVLHMRTLHRTRFPTHEVCVPRVLPPLPPCSPCWPIMMTSPWCWPPTCTGECMACVAGVWLKENIVWLHCAVGWAGGVPLLWMLGQRVWGVFRIHTSGCTKLSSWQEAVSVACQPGDSSIGQSYGGVMRPQRWRA